MSDRITLGELAGGGALGKSATPPELRRLRLTQPGSRDAARPGTFQNSATLENFTEVRDAVFLRMRLVRRMYSKGDRFDGEAALRCFSDDGKVPSPEVLAPVAAKCVACPAASWRAEGGRRLPPACKELVLSIVAAGKQRLPFLLEFAPSSVPAARAVYSFAQCNRIPLHAVEVTLRAEEKRRENGGYYQISIDAPRIVDDRDVPLVSELYTKLRDYPLKAAGGRGYRK